MGNERKRAGVNNNQGCNVTFLSVGVEICHPGSRSSVGDGAKTSMRVEIVYIEREGEGER